MTSNQVASPSEIETKSISMLLKINAGSSDAKMPPQITGTPNFFACIEIFEASEKDLMESRDTPTMSG